MPAEQVAAGLARIDTRTLAGKPDKALLTLLLMTSRRVSEVRLLTWSDIWEQAGAMKITFVEKGGDVHAEPGNHKDSPGI